MKKILIMSISMLMIVYTLSACALPEPGKVQVISSAKPSESFPSAAAKPSESSGEPPLTDEEISALIQEGIVPEDAAQESSGNAVYDERKVQDSIEKYRERVECTSTIIAGNNMIIQVKNTNEIAIPKMVVELSSPDMSQKQDLVFYQVGAGRSIVIPIEKKPDELPPAMDASVSVFMTANEYSDITDKINVSSEQADEGIKLTVQNNAQQACQMFSITVKFADDTGIVYAQMKQTDTPIEAGGSAELAFGLSEELKEAGVTFNRIEYVINQAVAQTE